MEVVLKKTSSRTADGKIVLSPERKFVLANMIAPCDLKAPPPADLAPWDVARPLGREVIDDAISHRVALLD